VTSVSIAAVKPALFLDRDGVLNVEVEYLRRPEDVVLIPGTARAVSELNLVGVPVIVVSNQSGLARGLFQEEDLDAVQRELARQLASSGASIDAWYHCPYHPAFPDRYAATAPDRKPAPGMLLRAAREHGLHLGQSIVVGDKLSDLEAGQRAGCRSLLVRTGYGADTERAMLAGPDARCPSLGTFDSLLDALSLLRAELTPASRR
jgi:D-glycero-D-manno-heptose 1,7-bisphosphate phosphatase